jgi:hypothetical protein
MLVVANGSVAVLDEFDAGIHDILVKALATSLYLLHHGGQYGALQTVPRQSVIQEMAV